MFSIIKVEAKLLFKNRPFVIVSLGFVILLLTAVFLGKKQSDQQEQVFTQAKEKTREQWENIKEINPHGAAHYGTYIFKQPGLMDALDEGVSGVTGSVLRIEGHVQNEIIHSESSQSMSISRFGRLRGSLLLQYVLPLLLIFVCFQNLSREKRSGRLKLLVLQGANPIKLVWAKTLTVFLYALLLLGITVLIFSLAKSAEFNQETGTRLMYFIGAYGLFYFLIIGLTMFFSVAFKNATAALTTMIALWVLWTMFLPNILMSSIESKYELPSRNEFAEAMKEDRKQGLDGHNPRDERAEQLKQDVLKEYGVDSVQHLPINFDGIRMQADEEYGNIVWDKHFGNIRSILKEQKEGYRSMGSFNPFIALQNASMGYAGNDNLHHQEFLVQAENYRRVFIKSLNDEHAFGGSKTGEWGWKPDEDFYKSIPDYNYEPVKLGQVNGGYRKDVLIIVCWVLVVGIVLTIASKRLRLL